MNDAYKYGTIKLSYEYMGDEYGSSKPHKIDMVLSNDVGQEELLERFEGFMKAIGYYFNPGERLGVVPDEMPYPDEWNTNTSNYTTFHDENGMAYSIGISGADGNYDLGAVGPELDYDFGAGDYSIMQNEADLYPPVPEEEEKAIEAALWDSAFKTKQEQMADTIAKEYNANVLP